MSLLPLLAVGFLMKLVAGLFVISSVFLVLVVLVQKNKGGGLGGVFGGGAAGGVLGSKTGDFLTWFTILLAGLFLVLSVVMVKFYKPSVKNYDSQTYNQTTPESQQQSMPQPPEGNVEVNSVSK